MSSAADVKRRTKKHRQRVRETNEQLFTSRKKLASFARSIDPTLKRESELKYLALLENPETAELVGIPMSIGGVEPASTKVRIRATGVIYANDQGETNFSIYNCRGPQERDDAPDQSVVGNIKGNHLPKWGYNNTTMQLEVINGVLGTPNTEPTTAQTPKMDSNSAVTGGFGFAIETPSMAIPLTKTSGRVVAQSIRVYPIGNSFTNQGTGYMFQSIDSASADLNDKTTSQLYGLQRTICKTSGLNQFPAGACFRSVRVPTAPQDVNWLPTDWSRLTSAPAYWNFASPIWAVFAADGCQPKTPFRVEIVTCYEFANNVMPYSTPNPPGLLELGLVQAGRAHLHPAIERDENIEKHGHARVADTLITAHGPRKALGMMSHAALGSFGEALKKGFETIAPKLLGMGVSALSEGLIPPQTIEAPTTYMIEALEGEGYGSDRLAPAGQPIGRPSVPSRIDEPDFVMVPQQAATEAPEPSPDGEKQEDADPTSTARLSHYIFAPAEDVMIRRALLIRTADNSERYVGDALLEGKCVPKTLPGDTTLSTWQPAGTYSAGGVRMD